MCRSNAPTLRAHGTRNARRKVLQTCEYCKRDRKVFCAVVTWEYTDHLGNTCETGKFTI